MYRAIKLSNLENSRAQTLSNLISAQDMLPLSAYIIRTQILCAGIICVDLMD